ncbi:uncharacterized protein LOC122317338 isoform X2 [Carya illinoinensis]|uniref:uncharacterized protein LOC122317338 isoform X2 n=1 Tax=Carya illinoinensis TaxID=32201 RepID=UPI001C71E7D2|nr:uncharacterized protein LOC122317338 isoform X2 [Carya illinoinensis]
MVSHCLLWIIIFYYFIKSLPTLSLVLFSFFKPEQPRALLSLALLQPASFLVYHSASPSIAFFPVFFQATKLSSWFCNSRNGFSQKTLATRPSSAKSILPLLDQELALAGRVSWSRELTDKEAEPFISLSFIDESEWIKL